MPSGTTSADLVARLKDASYSISKRPIERDVDLQAYLRSDALQFGDTDKVELQACY